MTEHRINPLHPAPSLLAKIGSIIAHVDEGGGPDGHHFDWHAVYALLADEEVRAWLSEMDKLALIPKRREGASVKGNP